MHRKLAQSPPIVLLILAFVEPILGGASTHVRFVPAKDMIDKKYHPQEPAGIADGGATYIARFDHGEGHVVGQWKKTEFRYTDDGMNHKTMNGNDEKLQVLVYPVGAMIWTPRDEDKTPVQDPPPNMAVIGFDHRTGEALYACRGNTPGGRAIGGVFRMSDSRGCEIIKSDGIAYTQEMEVMSLSFFGIVMKSVD